MNSSVSKPALPSSALITPSATPPPIRPSILQSYSISEPTPSSKRQRLSSTPRRDDHSNLPRPSQNINFHKEREASTQRLLDVWSQLAERYQRPLDEDDIVDIKSGEVVKDNGLTRSLRTLQFGTIVDPDANEDENADEEEEEEDGEDELDELDAFAGEDGDPEAERMPLYPGNVPPVSAMNPLDAQDLRDFMEAEKLRKEQFGDESEEDNNYVSDEEANHSETLVNEVISDFDSGEDGELFAEEEDYNSASADELDNWGIDESRDPHQGTPGENVDDHSDIEIIETSTPPPPPHSYPSPGKTKATPKRTNNISYELAIPNSAKSFQRKLQLQTPPLSQSSSDPSDLVPTIDIDNPFVKPHLSLQLPTHQNQSSSRKSKVTTGKRMGKSPRTHSRNRSLSLPVDSPPFQWLPFTSEKNSKSATNTVSPSCKSASFQLSPNKKKLVLQPEVVINVKRPLNLSRTSGSIVEDACDVTGTRISSSQMKTPSPKKATIGKRKEKPVPCDISINLDEISDDNVEDPYESDPINIQSSPLAKSRSPKRRPQSNVASTRSPSKYESNSSSKSPQKVSDVKRIHEIEPEFADLPLPPSKFLKSASLKRKRKSLSSEVELQEVPLLENSSVVNSLERHESGSSRIRNDRVMNFLPVHGSPSKRRMVRTPSQSEGSESNPGSSDDDGSPRHFLPEARFSTPQYGHPPTYYPSHHPHHDPQMFAPIPDPRAQFIITQAMQQLSALVGAPWNPSSNMIYTPTHHRHREGSTPMYRTPTHPHPYPYMYNPDLSVATLPPDSPDISSSSPSDSRERRKALVRRSRSRGRRVSFVIDKLETDVEETSVKSVTLASPSKLLVPEDRRGRQGQDVEMPPTAVRKGKGKGKMLERSDSDSDDELSPIRRGRPVGRAQTPGPPSARSDSLESTAFKMAPSSGIAKTDSRRRKGDSRLPA